MDSHGGCIALSMDWLESRLNSPFVKSITSINFLFVCIVLSLFESKYHLLMTYKFSFTCQTTYWIQLTLNNYKFSKNNSINQLQVTRTTARVHWSHFCRILISNSMEIPTRNSMDSDGEFRGFWQVIPWIPTGNSEKRFHRLQNKLLRTLIPFSPISSNISLSFCFWCSYDRYDIINSSYSPSCAPGSTFSPSCASGSNFSPSGTQQFQFLARHSSAIPNTVAFLARNAQNTLCKEKKTK